MNIYLCAIYFLLAAPDWFSVCGLCATIPKKSNEEPALLIISYDGFRPDFLNRNLTPNLNKFRSEGAAAPYMLNVFPTKTFVNHHTIATGCYPGEHGIAGPELYDMMSKEVVTYGQELFNHNKSVIPIWIANEMAEKHSGCMMWPGGDFVYNNHTATFGVNLNQSISWKNRVDTVMSWFTHKKKPTNLVMLYIEEPDKQSHVYGPDSEQVNNALVRVDKLTKYIQDQLIAHKLDKRVNVIHLSDHGMANLSPLNFIDLRKFAAADSFKWYGISPALQIVPNNFSKMNELYANLTKAAKEHGHFKIYNSKNLPKRWHMKNKRCAGPLIAVADTYYAFHDMYRNLDYFKRKYKLNVTNETMLGYHGYDNEDELMHAIFMAKGPMFNNVKLKPVRMIDLYNLFCLILDIKGGKNSGSKRRELWKKLLVKPPSIFHFYFDLSSLFKKSLT